MSELKASILIALKDRGPQTVIELTELRRAARERDVDAIRALTGDSGIVSQAAVAVLAELGRVLL